MKFNARLASGNHRRRLPATWWLVATRRRQSFVPSRAEITIQQWIASTSPACIIVTLLKIKPDQNCVCTMYALDGLGQRTQS